MAQTLHRASKPDKNKNAHHKRQGPKLDHDADFDALVQIAGEIALAAERVQGTCTKILGNAMATPLKNQADAKNAVHKIFMDIAGKIDSTRKHTERAIAQLEVSRR